MCNINARITGIYGHLLYSIPSIQLLTTLLTECTYRVGDICYKKREPQPSWSAASDQCVSWGGQLAAIHGDDVLQAINLRADR